MPPTGRAKAKGWDIAKTLGIAVALLHGVYVQSVQMPDNATADARALTRHEEQIAALVRAQDDARRRDERMWEQIGELNKSVANIEGRLAKRERREPPEVVRGALTLEARPEGG